MIKMETWCGSVGKADIENNIPLEPDRFQGGQHITKLFIGALVFKLIEDSANTALVIMH
jgi:hypothetical protein